ncbi:Hypothetical protein SMAX5B_019961 [Scophthalmus maximus]|uniref:Uncharacterized protein n=1 Tax=Scophthalmus maximus TaxID=52904 RepID=A0A2U9B421_SCOMX|nr:Hypothetical protein SMAX5B_019961 [Scophthalmus maximus]
MTLHGPRGSCGLQQNLPGSTAHRVTPGDCSRLCEGQVCLRERLTVGPQGLVMEVLYLQGGIAST